MSLLDSGGRGDGPGAFSHTGARVGLSRSACPPSSPRHHSAVVANERPYVIGGIGEDGAPEADRTFPLNGLRSIDDVFVGPLW